MMSFSELFFLGLSLWVILAGARSQEPQVPASLARARSQEPQVPALFIFGDSLVDNGNNNAILTLARANYRPYGIDFPQGTTGRFTNGRTYVDVLGMVRFHKSSNATYICIIQIF